MRARCLRSIRIRQICIIALYDDGLMAAHSHNVQQVISNSAACSCWAVNAALIHFNGIYKTTGCCDMCHSDGRQVLCRAHECGDERFSASRLTACSKLHLCHHLLRYKSSCTPSVAADERLCSAKQQRCTHCKRDLHHEVAHVGHGRFHVSRQCSCYVKLYVC